jgi:hypothetical protein
MRKKSAVKTWKSIRRFWDIITNPKRFFTKIVADGDLEESMLKAFMYGLLGGAMVLLLRMIGGHSIDMRALFNLLIITPVIAVVVLFLIGGLMMLVSEITGGERDWEIAVKGLASVFFIYPLILVLSALAWNCTSIWIISMAIDAYILFLFYNIGAYCMKGNKTSVLLAICVLGLFMLAIYSTEYRIGWFMLKSSSATLACLL